MYDEELEAKKAAIQEREEETMNAILWIVESVKEIDELEQGGASADYIATMREYAANGGAFPCWVIPTEDERYFNIYDSETEAVEAAFDTL